MSTVKSARNLSTPKSTTQISWEFIYIEKNTNFLKFSIVTLWDMNIIENRKESISKIIGMDF